MRPNTIMRSHVHINHNKLHVVSDGSHPRSPERKYVSFPHRWCGDSWYNICQSQIVAFSYTLILYCLYGWRYCNLSTNNLIIYVRWMLCHGKKWVSKKSLKPLFRILRFAALLIIFIVSIKIIGKLGWLLTTSWASSLWITRTELPRESISLIPHETWCKDKSQLKHNWRHEEKMQLCLIQLFKDM